jgi:hypothetical protein
MDKSKEIVVEIPPPEVPPGQVSRWVLVAVSTAMIGAVVVFVLATAPRIPPFEWRLVTGPMSVNLDSIVGTAEVFALLSGMTSEGVLLWWSDDGVEWESQPLRETRTQLAGFGDRLFAYGDIQGHLLVPVDEGWLATEGDVAPPDEVRSRQGSGRPSIVATNPGMLAMSILGDVWWAPDDQDFEIVIAEPEWGEGAEVGNVFDSACRPPKRTSPDVPPVLATDNGLVALVSSNPDEPFGIWPVCEPRLWVSPDGRDWTATEVGLEDGAYVYDVAWRDGRFTAVGGYGIGEPEVWSSSDGRDWSPLLAFPGSSGTDLYTVAAGPAGWVVLGLTEEDSDQLGWTSLDGVCWEPLPQGVSGSDAVVGGDAVLILDRTTYPDLWHGSLTGGTGSC